MSIITLLKLQISHSTIKGVQLEMTMTKRAVEQQRHSACRVIEVIARDPQYKFNEADSSQDVLQL